jgi:PPM family protein phosphatase
MKAWGCELACVSHPGKVRSHNEDAVLINGPAPPEALTTVCARRLNGSESLLLAVADGLGGHNAGEVASREAVRFLSRLPELTPEKLAEWLLQTHHHVRQLAERRPEWTGMGSTVAGLLAAPQGLWVFHLGDSRVYQLRDRFLELLTEDDSLASVLVHAGRLPGDAHRPAGTNALTQFLGGTATAAAPSPHLRPVNISGTRRFLLCTDGLSDAISLEEMEACMASELPPPAACEALLAAALRTEAKDNVSLIVADIYPAGSLPEDHTPKTIRYERSRIP